MASFASFQFCLLPVFLVASFFGCQFYCYSKFCNFPCINCSFLFHLWHFAVISSAVNWAKEQFFLLLTIRSLWNSKPQLSCTQCAGQSFCSHFGGLVNTTRSPILKMWTAKFYTDFFKNILSYMIARSTVTCSFTTWILWSKVDSYFCEFLYRCNSDNFIDQS